MENGSLELASSYGVSAGMGAGAGVFMIIWLALIVFFIYCGWKIFTKAGKPGWASLVPIYNIVVLLEITGKPIWWILLFLIPGVNLIMQIIVINELSQRFGKGVGFTVGLIFLPFIFIPILAFGSAKYTPAAGASATPAHA